MDSFNGIAGHMSCYLYTDNEILIQHVIHHCWVLYLVLMVSVICGPMEVHNNSIKVLCSQMSLS